MNIIVSESSDDQIENVLIGYAYALNAINFNVIKYSGITPLFRIFEQYKPAYFLLGASSISKVAQKAVAEFKPEVWVFHRKNEEYKLHIEEAKEIGVFSTSEVHEGQYHIPFGWDSLNYHQDKRDHRYVCDYAYIGRYKEELQSLLASFSEGGLRIYSPDLHQTLNYVGNDNNKPAIFASAGIVILPEHDGGIADTDTWNCLYSGAKCGLGSTAPKLDGSHSYFHRLYDLICRAYPTNEDLKTKLFLKMKEVER